MSFDWKSIVKTVAPMLGTALGGPMGGAATKFIAGALLDDESATDKQIAVAVASATPDQLMALKTADSEFQLAMEKIGVDLEKIAADDRDSARKRQIAMKDKTPAILGGLILLGFFGCLVMLAFVVLPAASADVVKVMVAALGVMSTGVVNYFFGSSAGSKEKTAQLAKSH